jgi:hypothetical protein
MLAIMEKKVERAFMITLHKSYNTKCLLGIALGLFLCTGSCAPDLVDDPIPHASFPDIVISISNYQALLLDGGYIYRPEGVRGIIIYRKNSTTFLAFERNCSFQPYEAGATVDVHSSTFYIFDPSPECNSSFNFEGNPIGGQAWRPLLQYQTSVSGNTLTIIDNVIQ